MKLKQAIEVLVREKFRLKRCACPRGMRQYL